MLPRAAGLLDLEFQARGTAHDPRFSGRVECTRCELEVDGMGDFKDVHLALHADTNKIVLDELTAKSGGGHARLTAALSRASGHGAYDLTGSIDATTMPVYQEGQPLATLTVNAALSGSAGDERARATIDIREARIKLSDDKRKNLQPLKAPADIVITQDGRPINRTQAKRLRADRRTACAARPGRGRGRGGQARWHRAAAGSGDDGRRRSLAQPAHRGERAAQAVGLRARRQHRAGAGAELPRARRQRGRDFRAGPGQARAHRRVRAPVRPEKRHDAGVRRPARATDPGRDGPVPERSGKRHGAIDGQGAAGPPGDRRHVAESPRSQPLAALHADHHGPPAIRRQRHGSGGSPARPRRTRRRP